MFSRSNEGRKVKMAAILFLLAAFRAYVQTLAEWSAIALAIYLYFQVYMTKAVVSKMKKSRDGQIIFVNSAAGQCPIWGYTAYGATKFAMRGFAEALFMELLPYNIHVSVIYPPNTNTEGYQVSNFFNLI